MTIDREELRKILPELIKTDDLIRGVILSSLEGILATKEDLKQQSLDLNQRFEVLQKQLNQRFDKVFERFDELSIAMGHDFEEFNSYWLQTFLIEQGYPEIEIRKRTFFDENYEVFSDSKNVEVDLFNEKPLVIGEVTSIVREIKKITTFLRKINFIEKKYGKGDFRLFITYAFLPEIRKEAITLLDNAEVKIITLRKRS